MSELFSANVEDVLAVLHHARFEDFVRYVSRQLREDESLAGQDFKTGWLIVVGSYANMAAIDRERLNDE